MITAAAPREDRLTLAIGTLAMAFLCFTIMDSIAKWLAAAGLPVLQVAFVRYAGHFVSSLAVFLPTQGRTIFHSNAPFIQLARAIALLTGTVLNFIALSYLPLTITTAFFFAAPMVICVLSVPLLGERIGARRFSAIVVGFCGVLIIANPFGESFSPAMIYSAGALVAASFYFVLTRMTAGIDNTPTGQIITSGLPTLVLLPFVVATWTWPQTTVDWIAVLAIGGLATLGHSLVTVASRFAPASTLGPVVYVQVVYATVISWVVFNAPPDGATILGTSIIVASGIYIWQRERALRRAVPVTTLRPPPQ